LWYQSAEFDPLTDVERTQLGLLADPRVRIWSTEASQCDQTAAAFYDPDRLAPGHVQSAILPDVADSACSQEVARPEKALRAVYQRGRAILAKHNVGGARQQFELAISQGYRAARVDLANLLVDPSAGTLDPERAASLYEQAWNSGVPIAAFELGHLYEFGVRSSSGAVNFQSDRAKSWFWYQKGAESGEPDALERFAERDERDAMADSSREKSNQRLLRAFEFYAAAAARASAEAWPNDAWKNCRYHRATLARLLAREGLMEEVASTYGKVLESRKSKPSTVFEWIEHKLH
jgi:TPR repeat protein